MTGTLGLNGTNSNALTGAHLINKGVATETGDYIGLNNSSVLENAGTLNLTDGFEIFSNDTTANQLENDASGTINYTSTAAASTQISVAMVNAGMLTLGGNSTLDVNGPSFDNSGTGTVNAGGTTTFSAEAGNSVSNVDAGTYSVASGAAVDFAGGTRTIGAATFTGTGPVHVSASLDVADPVSIPNLQLDSGSLAGPATLTVTGTLGLNGTNSNALTGAHLINKGVATETGDYIGLNNSSVLENAGTLNLTDGFEIFSNDTTANQLENDASGTINYTGSTASSTTSISVSTTNNGLISVTKGTLTDTELTNLVSGTLTGGSYNATNGTINVGAVITTNAANITLGGLAGLIGNGSASAC